LRQWINLIEMAARPIRWFHRTTLDRVPLIKQHGLQINSENNLTTAGEWAFEVYDCRPIFLSRKPDTNDYKSHAPILLEVDVTGLPLVADLPALVDLGAYYDIDDWCMWFDTGPELSFDDLINPSSPVCLRAIRKTKTAACLTSIEPDRIRFLTKLDEATLMEASNMEIVEVRGSDVKVWINPSHSLFFNLLKRSNDRVRGIVDADEHLYVWNAAEAIHSDIERGLGIRSKFELLMTSDTIYTLNQSKEMVNRPASVTRAYGNQHFEVIRDSSEDNTGSLYF